VANPDFFKRLGLFVVPQFFDGETCMKLRAAARQGAPTSATVYDGEGTEKHDDEVRRTSRALVEPGILELVTARVEALKPAVQRHFGVPITTFREPQFLVYHPGDFFSAHRDASPDDPPNVRIRKVTLVIFLNGQAEQAHSDSFSGGSLVFYDLFDEPKLGRRGLPLAAEEGLLVAFPADRVHRVSPVTGGERHTIVTWFT
jgi:predicted 2-oxoglutarate/Fe(II)-dependent dioxygenase YbiX